MLIITPWKWNKWSVTNHILYTSFEAASYEISDDIKTIISWMIHFDTIESIVSINQNLSVLPQTFLMVPMYRNVLSFLSVLFSAYIWSYPIGTSTFAILKPGSNTDFNVQIGLDGIYCLRTCSSALNIMIWYFLIIPWPPHAPILWTVAAHMISRFWRRFLASPFHVYPSVLLSFDGATDAPHTELWHFLLWICDLTIHIVQIFMWAVHICPQRALNFM